MERRVHSGARTGFTLIELLVVIAIIGLLASIILASLNTAQQKGRDARRLGDIRDIQNALELYDVTCRSYPNTLSGSASNGCPSGTTFSTFISPFRPTRVPAQVIYTPRSVPERFASPITSVPRSR